MLRRARNARHSPHGRADADSSAPFDGAARRRASISVHGNRPPEFTGTAVSPTDRGRVRLLDSAIHRFSWTEAPARARRGRRPAFSCGVDRRARAIGIDTKPSARGARVPLRPRSEAAVTTDCDPGGSSVEARSGRPQRARGPNGARSARGAVPSVCDVDVRERVTTARVSVAPRQGSRPRSS